MFSPNLTKNASSLLPLYKNGDLALRVEIVVTSTVFFSLLNNNILSAYGCHKFICFTANLIYRFQDKAD